ncbi:sensor histidine kinase [Cryptosporangium aurantiacum]|uniref:histidine kinase n=1 Tax=Cryptosporangium aurantiacum TaxID=134849 RepID=A0A1M7TVB1_9ACTN|nr:ATP-binding protein [Cryptosporangium aurantiacum]SHN74628.1 Histidine kinase-, DNA gyrase B-, and HSP90-like ATPase [Cryptosporangium aurantiacum]
MTDISAASTPRETAAPSQQQEPPPGADQPPAVRARLWWIVVLALVLVALIGAAAAVLTAAFEPTIWHAVGAAAGWLLVLLGALLAVNAAVRPIGTELAAERAARTKAERAAWEAQWRDNSNRAALEEQQRGIAVAVAQVNAALADSVRELARVAEEIRGGDSPDVRPPALSAEGWPAPLIELHGGVQQLLQASFGVASLTASHQPVGVLITLARRLQPLIHRAIKELDALESQVEDPDLLNALFQLDHLVTRARRQAESIAVLGGATARQIRKPVPVYTVLRQAIAEIEHYGRVKVLRPVQGTIIGPAVTEVIHLIAELVENATVFSPPESRVQIQVDLVPDGLSIEIDDLGLVMSAELRQRMNQLLTTPERLDVGEQLKDGRIGLIVVAAIARRYQIRVRLERNERGGNRALVVLPAKLLSDEPLRRSDLGPSALPAAPVPVAAAIAPPAHAAEPGVLSTLDRERLAEISRDAMANASRTRPPTHNTTGTEGAALGEVDADRKADSARPPLPRRDGQHMAPELRNPIRAEDSEPGAHNPGLFASYQRGRERADAQEPPAAPPTT